MTDECYPGEGRHAVIWGPDKKGRYVIRNETNTMQLAPFTSSLGEIIKTWRYVTGSHARFVSVGPLLKNRGWLTYDSYTGEFVSDDVKLQRLGATKRNND